MLRSSSGMLEQEPGELGVSAIGPTEELSGSVSRDGKMSQRTRLREGFVTTEEERGISGGNPELAFISALPPGSSPSGFGLFKRKASVGMVVYLGPALG